MHTIDPARLQQWTEDWVALDGTHLTIRPIHASDLALEQAFVDHLSSRTGYLRLLSPRHLTNDELKRFTDIDYRNEMALIAVETIDGRPRQVGVARFIKHADPADADRPDADFAIVLADGWQARGLGHKLLGSLIRVARQMAVGRLTDFTLSDNTGMLRLARKLGFELKRYPGEGSITYLTLDLRSLDDTASDGVGPAVR